MIFPLIIVALMPYITAFLWTLVSTQPTYNALSTFGFALLIFSPLWTIFIGWMFYWWGKSIEVIDTAKTVVSLANDNKHHAVNAFNFLKRKVTKS